MTRKKYSHERKKKEDRDRNYAPDDTIKGKITNLEDIDGKIYAKIEDKTEIKNILLSDVPINLLSNYIKTLYGAYLTFITEYDPNDMSYKIALEMNKGKKDYIFYWVSNHDFYKIIKKNEFVLNEEQKRFFNLLKSNTIIKNHRINDNGALEILLENKYFNNRSNNSNQIWFSLTDTSDLNYINDYYIQKYLEKIVEKITDEKIINKYKFYEIKIKNTDKLSKILEDYKPNYIHIDKPKEVKNTEYTKIYEKDEDNKMKDEDDIKMKDEDDSKMKDDNKIKDDEDEDVLETKKNKYIYFGKYIPDENKLQKFIKTTVEMAKNIKDLAKAEKNKKYNLVSIPKKIENIREDAHLISEILNNSSTTGNYDTVIRKDLYIGPTNPKDKNNKISEALKGLVEIELELKDKTGNVSKNYLRPNFATRILSELKHRQELIDDKPSKFRYNSVINIGKNTIYLVPMTDAYVYDFYNLLDRDYQISKIGNTEVNKKISDHISFEDFLLFLTLGIKESNKNIFYARKSEKEIDIENWGSVCKDLESLDINVNNFEKISFKDYDSKENTGKKEIIKSYFYLFNFFKIYPTLTLPILLFIDTFHDFGKGKTAGLDLQEKDAKYDQLQIFINKLFNIAKNERENYTIARYYRNQILAHIGSNNNKTFFPETFKGTILNPLMPLKDSHFQKICSILWDLTEFMFDKGFEKRFLYSYIIYFFIFSNKITCKDFTQYYLLEEFTIDNINKYYAEDFVKQTLKIIKKDNTKGHINIDGNFKYIPAGLMDANRLNTSSSVEDYLTKKEDIRTNINPNTFTYTYDDKDCELDVYGYNWKKDNPSVYLRATQSCKGDILIPVADKLKEDKYEDRICKDKYEKYKLLCDSTDKFEKIKGDIFNRFNVKNEKQISENYLIFSHGSEGISRTDVLGIIFFVGKKYKNKKENFPIPVLDRLLSLKRLGDFGQIQNCKELGIPLLTHDSMENLLAIANNTSTIFGERGTYVYYNSKTNSLVSNQSAPSNYKGFKFIVPKQMIFIHAIKRKTNINEDLYRESKIQKEAEDFITDNMKNLPVLNREQLKILFEKASDEIKMLQKEDDKKTINNIIYDLFRLGKTEILSTRRELRFNVSDSLITLLNQLQYIDDNAFMNMYHCNLRKLNEMLQKNQLSEECYTWYYNFYRPFVSIIYKIRQIELDDKFNNEQGNETLLRMLAKFEITELLNTIKNYPKDSSKNTFAVVEQALFNIDYFIDKSCKTKDDKYNKDCISNIKSNLSSSARKSYEENNKQYTRISSQRIKKSSRDNLRKQKR